MMKALLGLILILPQAATPTFTVGGTVQFKGDIPKAKANKRVMEDPACAECHPEAPPQENLVVDPAGGVKWAFVYVKAGLEGRAFPVPAAPVAIDQKGCTYSPHVVGARTGQGVSFRNSDKMLHNVHPIPFVNKEFNFGQPGGAVEERKFPQAEVPIKVICNVHPWMACFVCVVDHPFFAVTDAAGRFEIKGLPAGTYTLGVWHEELKFPDQVIVVKADQQVRF
ncbi:MAG: hypothetical protein JO332_13315 [Planctomycetaceae bacterium]|nr:hypothetical protein [Planctomycetaceae bacterium]